MKAFIFTSALLATLAAVPVQAANWETWNDCQYMTGPTSSGDCFQIRTGKGEETIRLYAVAASGEYFADNREALGVSAIYAGVAGQSAAEFTKKQLEGKSFQVITRRQPAGKSGAVYAYVIVGTADLGQTLVGNGWAVVHGLRPARPGEGALTYLGALRDAEVQAQLAGKGVWSYAKSHAPASNMQTDTGYRMSAANVRHNVRCRYYKLKGNTSCGPKDGTPCKVCGG